MSIYNYDTFDLATELPSFDAFRDALHVGQLAPDFPVEDLEGGEMVRMKSLWAKGLAVIEFGSFT